MNVQLSDLRFNRTARLSYESSSLLCEVARVSRVVLSFARRKINCEIISPRKSSFDFCQQLVVWHTACVVLMENNFPPLSFASTTLTTFTYSAFLLFTSRKIHGFNHWKAFFFVFFFVLCERKISEIIFREISLAANSTRLSSLGLTYKFILIFLAFPFLCLPYL